MFDAYMFCDIVLLLSMLFSASSMFEIHILVASIVMLYILELIMEIMPNCSTIQKPNCSQFPELSMTNLSDAMRPKKFVGTRFKRWHVNSQLWLQSMKVWDIISNGLHEGATDEVQNKFKEANTNFICSILSVLDGRLCDVYMHIKNAKEL